MIYKHLLLPFMTVVIMAGCSKEDETSPLHTSENISKSAADQSPLVVTSPAPFFTNLFDVSGGGWTGGDGAYSIPLPDGRILWTFGDSFLGTVNPDYSRPGTPLINNSFVIQDGNQLTTLHGGTAANPSAYVIPFGDPSHFYWPADGTVIGNKLYMFMLRVRLTGTGGPFGFETIGTDMAVFSLPDIQLINQYEIVRTTQVLVGVSIYEEGEYIYTYGTRSTFGKNCLVARLNINDPNEIEYWNGTDWGSEIVIDAYLKRGNGENLFVSNMFSVFKRGNKYHLLTQQDFFGSLIYLYTGDSPIGPWYNQIEVYDTPETGYVMWTYNAICHPHIVHPTKGMLVSYSTNALNFFDLFNDVRNYRPRFFWLNEA